MIPYLEFARSAGSNKPQVKEVNNGEFGIVNEITRFLRWFQSRYLAGGHATEMINLMLIKRANFSEYAYSKFPSACCTEIGIFRDDTTDLKIKQNTANSFALGSDPWWNSWRKLRLVKFFGDRNFISQPVLWTGMSKAQRKHWSRW